ncbi:MAG TPA: hypothetical protein VE669_11740 [Actinomycetota bacterium]|nr:hypothetical protein [Actinomycetota bacterium]
MARNHFTSGRNWFSSSFASGYGRSRCTACSSSVAGYRSSSRARYALTRFVKRSRARFQSNHHRGYFCRNTIISRGPKRSSPPAPAATYVTCLPVLHDQVAPLTLPSTMRIGIAARIRKNVVTLSSGRSG